MRFLHSILFVISVFMPIAFPPDCLISSVIDVSLEFLLAASATDAPLEANFIERDFPIPEDAQVITQTFPDRSIEMTF